MIGCSWSLFGIWESTNLKRENSEQMAAPQVLDRVCVMRYT
jgi:hypothetical protein